MKNKVSWLMIAMVLLASLMLSGEAMVQAAPQIPANFSGTITPFVPAGTTIRVLADGVQVLQSTTAESGGVAGYGFGVPIADPDDLAAGGAPIGSTLTFEVNGMLASETAVANPGANQTLNLTLIPITPTFTPTPTVTPSPTPPPVTVTPMPAGEQCPTGDACATLLDDDGFIYWWQDIVFPPRIIGDSAIILEADKRFWKVIDSREGTPQGWQLMIRASGDFTDGNGNSIPLSGFFFDVFTQDIVSIGNTGIPPTGGSGIIGLVDTPLLTANAGEGNGEFDFAPTFRLNVPAGTTPGIYTTDIFVTEGGGL